MREPRPEPNQTVEVVMTVLATVSAILLLIGVARTLSTGQTSLWPIAAAVVLAVCLTLMRSLRRTRGAGSGRTPQRRTLGAASVASGDTQPHPARQG